jgi:transposase
MPKLLAARPPMDAAEDRQVRRLARSHHAPADWVWHARMIVASWDGRRTRAIAEDLSCHAQTVRERVQAFNERGVEGLRIKPGGGRRPRLTEAERSILIALARSTPPGKLVPEPDSGELQAHDEAGEEGVAEWTLDALAEAARSHGIQVARSQVRRILLAEGMRWRRTRLWATSTDPDLAPKGRGSSPAPRLRRRERRSSVSTNWVP